MKLRMHENSLFALLLRSPWWISAILAAGIFGVIRIWLAVIYAIFAALPFIVIACYVLWKQLNQPSAAQIAKRLETLRALPQEDFARALEAAFRSEGAGVTRLEKGPIDFEVSKGGRVSLVLSRRWKAAHTGVAALEELEALRVRQKADAGTYIAAGEVSEAARRFAFEKSIRLIDGPALAKLLK